jgi:hypothetical protein
VMSTLASKRRRDNDSDDEDYLQKLAAEVEYAILLVSTLPDVPQAVRLACATRIQEHTHFTAGLLQR